MCPWTTRILVEICIGLEINGYLRPSSDRPSYGGLASDSRRDFRPVNVRFGSKASTQQLRPRSALPPKADKERKSWYVRFVPCVDGSELARLFFTFAGWSVAIQGGALIFCRASPANLTSCGS